MTRRLYVIAAAFAFAGASLSTIATFFLFSRPPCTVSGDTLGDFQAHGLTVYSDLNKFLISLAIVIAGLAGGLVLLVAKDKFALPAWSLSLLFASFMLSVVSIYFGYVSYSSLFEAILNRCIDLAGDRLKLPQLIQYYSMLAALLCVIGVAVGAAVRSVASQESS